VKKLDRNVNYLHFDFFTAFCSDFPGWPGTRGRRSPSVPKVYFLHGAPAPLPFPVPRLGKPPHNN
jgi:hypothetical protein